MNLQPALEELTIRTKDVGEVIPFKLNWAQRRVLDVIEREYDSGQPIRIVVLKARQLGISTLLEGIVFLWAWLFHHTNSLVIAHEEEPSENLFGMIKFMWEEWPFAPFDVAKNLTRKRLTFEERGSSIRIATAKNVKTGRSMTIHAMHGSEVAFWHDPKTLMVGLKQTIPRRPGTIICLESTANGMGNYFYDLWQDAKAGKNGYIPIFLAWWQHPEYTASFLNASFPILHYDEAEIELAKIMGAAGLSKEEVDDRLAWRRLTIAGELDGDEQRFKQEYPATDTEAFLAEGSNVFPLEDIVRAYAKVSEIRGRLERDPGTPRGVKFTEDRTGPLTIYAWPAGTQIVGDKVIPGEQGAYLIGGDPKRNPAKGDYACAQVINRRNYEQVATWHARLDPMAFAEQLYLLGMFYNRAIIAPENTGPGYATVGHLSGLSYPNIWINKFDFGVTGVTDFQEGWNSNVRSKELAVGLLRRLVVERGIRLHDERTVDEMKVYVTLPVVGFGPAASTQQDRKFDDRVMALAIACAASHFEGGVMPVGEDLWTPAADREWEPYEPADRDTIA